MKKQYLISLLGLFAIFIPFGSGLINTNLSSSTDEKTTGLAMKKTSKISLIDNDNSNNVSEGDTINSIYFEGEWVSKNRGNPSKYQLDSTLTEGLNLYSSLDQNVPLLEVSYNKLRNKGNYEWIPDSKILTYNIEVNSSINRWIKIWDYSITDGESFNITADYNDSKYYYTKEIYEDDLGEIKLVLCNQSIIMQTSEVVVTSPTEAKVKYEVTPGLDENNQPVTVEKVSWMNNSLWIGPYISDGKKTGTLKADGLEPNQWYNDTYIVAEMSDGTSTEKTKIDPFQMDTDEKKSTIKGDKFVNVTGATTAEYSYVVSPGRDVNGKPVTVEEVKWMNGDDELATSTEEEGTLYANDLKPNQWYDDTTVTAYMSDGTSTKNLKVYFFKTDECNDPSTVKQIDPVNVTGPTTAEVNYYVDTGSDKNGDPVTVKKVVWVKGKKVDGKSELAKDIEGEGDGIDGTLKTNKLNPSQKYDDTSLMAYMSDGTWTEATVVDPFQADQEFSTIKQVDNVNVTGANSANVSYEVDPGRDVNGKKVEVEEVRWKDGNDTLASSTKEKDTLYTTKLDPNQYYDQTTITAKMSDNKWIDPVTIRPFKTKPCNDPSTIKKTSNVEVTGTTSAEVNYDVDTGKDEDGHFVLVKEVKWMDGGDELATSKATSGTLETDKLNTNQQYKNTTIQAEMSDGSSTNKVIIEPFQADPSNVDSTIKENGVVNVTSSTEANVSYAVTAGKDVWGDPVTVEKVEWKNGNEVLATDEVNTENGIDGSLETNKLSPNQPYNNTEIIAYMSDESETEPVPLEPFKADPGNVSSTIKEVGEVNVTSSTEANVSYDVTTGKDVDGKAVTVEKVEWKNGNEVLATDEVNTENGIDGSLETNKLSPNQPYNNTEIIAYMSDESETEPVPLEHFKADPGNVSSTIKEVGEVNVTSSTEANVSYDVTTGKDVDGKAVTVEKVEWIDLDKGTTLATDEVNKGNGIDGTLETDKLSSNQSYNNTKIIAYMSDESETEPVPLEHFDANPSLPTNEVEAINIDEGNGILQIEGKITKNEATIKEINLIDIKTGNVVPTKCEITDNGDGISYSIFTDQYNGDINNYKLQISYQIDGKEQSPLENEYKDIQNPENITENTDLSYLIDTDDLKLGWIIAGSLIVLILCIAVIGFFVF